MVVGWTCQSIAVSQINMRVFFLYNFAVVVLEKGLTIYLISLFLHRKLCGMFTDLPSVAYCEFLVFVVVITDHCTFWIGISHTGYIFSLDQEMGSIQNRFTFSERIIKQRYAYNTGN